MKEYQIGNATVCITRPELTQAERAKREARVMVALQQYGKAVQEKAARDD